MSVHDQVKKKPKLELNDSQDEGYFDCLICSEEWTSRGEHRLVSLQCGHLFGKKCIERWIYNKTKKPGSKAMCPICMKVTYERHIWIVQPTRIAVKDTTQTELLKRELEALKRKIKEAEKDIDLSQLALSLHKKELERAKERKQRPIHHHRYVIKTSKKLSEKRHTARVMALDALDNKAYIAFKSTENTHDIMTLDLTSMTASLIPVHCGLIRDVQYSNQSILSTGHDKTLKLTSTTTHKVEHSIPLTLPGWTCRFDTVDTTKIYCGLGDSSICIYDIRNTSHVLQKLVEPNHVQKSPLHSMYIHPKGIVCANLNGVFVWNNNHCTVLNTHQPSDYKPYSLSCVYGTEDDILLSTRNHHATKHQHLRFHGGNTTVLTTFDSPRVQNSLTRTCLFKSSSDQPVLCYGDESNGMLRLVQENHELQHFKIHSCPLDIQPFKEDKLAFLTDNRFFLLEKKQSL